MEKKIIRSFVVKLPALSATHRMRHLVIGWV